MHEKLDSVSDREMEYWQRYICNPQGKVLYTCGWIIEVVR